MRGHIPSDEVSPAVAGGGDRVWDAAVDVVVNFGPLLLVVYGDVAVRILLLVRRPLRGLLRDAGGSCRGRALRDGSRGHPVPGLLRGRRCSVPRSRLPLNNDLLQIRRLESNVGHDVAEFLPEPLLAPGDDFARLDEELQLWVWADVCRQEENHLAPPGSGPLEAGL